MNIQEVLQYCLAKNGSYKDFPFGPLPTVIKVGSKLFAIITDNSISLKCDPITADFLRNQYPAVTPGYHLNKQHWNTVLINDTVPLTELKWMVDHSYDLVFKSLKKYEKENLQVK